MRLDSTALSVRLAPALSVTPSVRPSVRLFKSLQPVSTAYTHVVIPVRKLVQVYAQMIYNHISKYISIFVSFFVY